MQLARAIKQRLSPPIRHEINFNPLVRSHDRPVLQSALYLQPMPLQMQRNDLIARVVNLQSIARARSDLELLPAH